MKWNATAVATPSAAGTPAVEVTRWATGAVSAPAVTGVPKIDVAYWKGVAADDLASDTDLAIAVRDVPNAIPAVGSMGADIAAIADVNATVNDILVDTGTTLDAKINILGTKIDTIDTNVDTILDTGGGGSGTDPWLTELPGDYTGAQAGKILGDIPAMAAGLEIEQVVGTQPGGGAPGMRGIYSKVVRTT
jgi:hypothetical protein